MIFGGVGAMMMMLTTNNKQCLCVHCVLRDGLVHDAPINYAPADGSNEDGDGRGGGVPSSPIDRTGAR